MNKKRDKLTYINLSIIHQNCQDHFRRILCPVKLLFQNTHKKSNKQINKQTDTQCNNFHNENAKRV